MSKNSKNCRKREQADETTSRRQGKSKDKPKTKKGG
jgi:hypothetical protein